MVVNVTLSPQLIGFAKRLEAELDAAHLKGAIATEREERRQIRSTDTRASKGFLNSITREFEQQGAAKVWLTGASAVYGEWANRGRGAGPAKGKTGTGMPPVWAIQRWMGFRGITATPPMTNRSLAFLIARKIMNKGWTGRYPFTRALVFAPGLIETAFNKSLAPLQAEIQ